MLLHRETTPEEDDIICKMIFGKFSHFTARIFGPGYCKVYNYVKFPEKTKDVLINVETKTIFDIWFHDSNIGIVTTPVISIFKKRNLLDLSTTKPHLLLENFF